MAGLAILAKPLYVFVYLREGRDFSVLAIKECHTALSIISSLRKKKISGNLVFQLVFQNFERSHLPREEATAWNVTPVLQSWLVCLMHPWNCCWTDRHLTLKTCFLLALASAKRVSKLHGLSYKVKHSRGLTSCTLSFLHSFVAKTQHPALC